MIWKQEVRAFRVEVVDFNDEYDSVLEIFLFGVVQVDWNLERHQPFGLFKKSVSTRIPSWERLQTSEYESMPGAVHSLLTLETPMILPTVFEAQAMSNLLQRR